MKKLFYLFIFAVTMLFSLNASAEKGAFAGCEWTDTIATNDSNDPYAAIVAAFSGQLLNQYMLPKDHNDGWFSLRSYERGTILESSTSIAATTYLYGGKFRG